MSSAEVMKVANHGIDIYVKIHIITANIHNSMPANLGVCQISKQNLAGPGVGPYSPERQSPRSLLGL